MKFHGNGVNWGGPKDDWYWFYWWNWLPKNLRYFGYAQDWYDGPISSFGFWIFNWTWCFPITGHNGEKSLFYLTSKKKIDKKDE